MDISDEVAAEMILRKLETYRDIGANDLVRRGDFCIENRIPADVCNRAIAHLLAAGQLELFWRDGQEFVRLKRIENHSDLLAAALRVSPGLNTASEYHDAVFELLKAMFSGVLTYPVKEDRITEGRRRVDIGFTNTAERGFFAWLSRNFHAAYIWIECKNYTGEVTNADVDQIAGRFSRHRGEFGLLICRRIENRTMLVKRCRDVADAPRGFVIPLDDEDLKTLVTERLGPGWEEYSLLKRRFDELVK